MAHAQRDSVNTPHAQSSVAMIENLEPRRLFAVGTTSVPHLHAESPSFAAVNATLLTAEEVDGILARALKYARPGQVIAVSDREGVILGIAVKTPRAGDTRDVNTTALAAIARARTGAYFQSTQNAFTTRTARFIIQDHFPDPIFRTSGGPLYGVQFSSLPGSDIVNGPFSPVANNSLSISGDPGGVPLYKKVGKARVPVGGIGVAGDGFDVIARPELRGLALPADPTNPRSVRFTAQGKVFNGKEERDLDERVALAGAYNFRAPSNIVASKILLANTALRFPFAVESYKKKGTRSDVADFVSRGQASILGNTTINKTATIDASVAAPYPTATFGGITGQLKNTSRADYGIVGSDDTGANGDPLDESIRLTEDDVRTIIENAVSEALRLRAGIRQPIGSPVQIHVAVTDRDGTVLGVFRMTDGTNFSFDVAVQKARTAAFFSDNDHALSSRAVGFMAQKHFPAGIDDGSSGPLFGLQQQLSLDATNLKGPLANGITIFPGGVPLYKGGELVGAIGISGDGVEEDDQVAFAGTKGFRPREGIRSDEIDLQEMESHILAKVTFLRNNYTFSRDPIEQVADGFDSDLESFRIPYVKFKRNPER